MKITAILLMLLTILVKFLGLLRDIILAHFYGATNVSDAYIISTTIPFIIFSFIGTGLVTSYIPMYSSIEKERGVRLADRFTSSVINIILLLCTLLVIIVLSFTTPIIKLFASGFEGETLNLAVSFTRISIFAVFFSGLVYVFTGYLQLKKMVTLTALISIPLNLVIITSIILSSQFTAKIISIGNVLAIITQLIFLLPFVLKKGFKYSFLIEIKDSYVKKMLYLSLPVILGVSVNQINVLVDRTIASQIISGGITALTLANRVNLFAQGVIVMSVVTAMFPLISKMAVERNIEGLKKSLIEATNIISLLIVPATVGAMIFAEPIVKLLFGRGEFNSQAISMTSQAFFYYSLGMIGYGMREVLSRAFYSLQDTKTPMINAIIAMTLNIILNLILSRYMGINGLALATSISAISCTLLLYLTLRKKIGKFALRKVTISFVKITLSSLIMGFSGKFLYIILSTKMSFVGSTILTLALCVLIYLILVILMKVDDIYLLKDKLKYMLKKSKITN